MAGGAPVSNSGLIKCVCDKEQTDPASFVASWSSSAQGLLLGSCKKQSSLKLHKFSVYLKNWIGEERYSSENLFILYPLY